MPASGTSWYASGFVRRVCGVSQRELDYWEQRGLICPSEQRASGKGTDRRYSYLDLVKVRVIKELRSAGLSLQKIRKAVGKHRGRNPDADLLAQEYLITDGRQLHRFTDDPAVLEDMLSNRQLVFSVVFVGAVRSKVEKGISRLERQTGAVRRRAKRAVSG
jgi:DNA-binding transcriptional MerR regulator